MVLVVEVEEATTMAVIYSPAKYILLMVMVVEEEPVANRRRHGCNFAGG
jgi:hypothetical protein